METRVVRYGEDPSQWAELSIPDGPSRGVVVVIHGGLWRAAYDAGLGRPLAADLVGRGWTAYNIEFRRVGNGGGVPETLDDVAAAVDALAGLDVDGGPVIALGHSTGGHLAAWAAARRHTRRWGEAAVGITHLISQAGIVDLTRAAAEPVSGEPTVEFAGPPGPAYDELDPARLPVVVPTWCVHARDDRVVPFDHAAGFVEAAGGPAAGVHLVEVPGGHFGVITPGSPAWATQVKILDRIATRPAGPQQVTSG